MQLKKLFRRNANASQIFPKTEEIDTGELINYNENNSLLQREVNIDNTKTANVRLMDMSIDKKWACYVSQHENDEKKITTILSRRRFTAINDKTSQEEYFSIIPDYNTLSSYQSTVQIEASPQLPLIQTCIDEWYDKIDNNSQKFLSISQNGLYIAFSTYVMEDKKNKGACFIFKIENSNISFQCEINCNGYAAFMGRGDEICLAILNPFKLRIYKKIDNFQGKLCYDTYNFKTTKTDTDGSRMQLNYSNYFCTNIDAVLSKAASKKHHMFTRWTQHIIVLSTFIKYNLLMTPFTEKSNLIHFWSLKDNGILLSTLVAQNELVLTISDDFNFVATANDYSRRDNFVRIYNLDIENSLLFTIKPDISMKKWSHAAFFQNSRYIALSAIKGYDFVTFEVWDIEDKVLVYSGSKCMGRIHYNSNMKMVVPFVSEETTEYNERILKGFYPYQDEDGNISTRCFKLDFKYYKNGIIQWCSSDSQYDEHLDDLLKDYTEKVADERYELTESLDETSELKCGEISEGNEKYLVRCGKHMIQLWHLAKNSLDHQLVYIKPYTKSDNRSFYVSANVWRINTFSSIRYICGNSRSRIKVDIVEDDWYLYQTRRTDLTIYTDEFILPIPDDPDFDYHRFESACQALYYLNICLIENIKVDSIKLLQKTMKIIKEEIEKIVENQIAFQTISGSKTLSMLASFEKGRDILKLLLNNEAIQFIISSYKVTLYDRTTIDLSEEMRYNTALVKRQWLANNNTHGYRNARDRLTKQRASKKQNIEEITENVLIVLLRERQYHLYHLMLNRLLLDSKRFTPRCLSIVNDVIFFLKESKDNDHFEKTCQKLSYLPVGINTCLPSEKPRLVPYNADALDLIDNIRNIHCFSSQEQLVKLGSQVSDEDILRNKLKIVKDGLCSILCKMQIKVWSSYKNLGETKSADLLVMCVVPFPYLNTFNRITARDTFVNYSKGENPEESPYTKRSKFLDLALYQYTEPNIWKSGGGVMAIILQYKWNTFIKTRFFRVCAVYLIYYVTYFTGVQFALELYNYDSTSAERSITAYKSHLFSVVIFFISGAYLLYLEFCQIPKNRYATKYLRSWYNVVDLLAIIFPVITFLQLILNLNHFYEISSVCTLILWLHGMIRFRVFSSVGITLETIVQLFEKVISVICIFLAIIAGFTHSFMVLLRRQPDEYFQENYDGEISLSVNDSTIEGKANLYDISSSNGFKDPFKALYHVWLFIYGVWDPITTGDSGDDRMIFVLCMVFAFITVFIFTNMIIALMSSTVEEVKKRGKKVWMTYFAAVIAEIEDLASENTKHDRVNNPALLYYLGNSLKVKNYQEMLQKETQELRKILQMDVNEDLIIINEIKANIKLNNKLLTKLNQEFQKMKDRQDRQDRQDKYIQTA